MWCGELGVELEWVHQVQTSLNTESHRKHFYPKQTKKIKKMRTTWRKEIVSQNILVDVLFKQGR